MWSGAKNAKRSKKSQARRDDKGLQSARFARWRASSGDSSGSAAFPGCIKHATGTKSSLPSVYSNCKTAIADTGNGSWRGLASRDLSLRFSKCERFLQGRLRGADEWEAFWV